MFVLLSPFTLFLTVVQITVTTFNCVLRHFLSTVGEVGRALFPQMHQLTAANILAKKIPFLSHLSNLAK